MSEPLRAESLEAIQQRFEQHEETTADFAALLAEVARQQQEIARYGKALDAIRFWMKELADSPKSLQVQVASILSETNAGVAAPVSPVRTPEPPKFVTPTCHGPMRLIHALHVCDACASMDELSAGDGHLHVPGIRAEDLRTDTKESR